MDKLKIFAPATVSNVSCAFDILGFALREIGDEMTFEKTAQKGIQIVNVNDNQLPTHPEKNVAGVVALAMLEKAKPGFGVRMSIKKGIKPGSGIGSSGASAAGAAFGINKLLGDPYDTKTLVEFAMLGESLASGEAHADNAAPALFGGFTLVRTLHPLDIVPLPVPNDLYVTLLHPLIEVRTKEAREILKPTVLLKDAVAQWGNVAGLISGIFLADYELIGRSLNDVIVEPVRAGLIPYFYEMKAAAVQAGALGSGISGSGPSVYALSKGRKRARAVAHAMREAFTPSGIDFDLYVSDINPEGVHIL
jgi:homoserine kinase